MTNSILGRLERVDLRYIWESEATGFTPWLAREENLALLSEAIGLDLELEAQERNVGPFRADILCKETTDNQWVLIENQLEKTDHTHLGQLLTYAAGLQAVTIVWIAQRFTEEHRAALDWLNEITDDRFNFFGLEIELWKIGESPVAPKFNIISHPNDWSRTISQSARRIEQAPTETKQQQMEFWQAFLSYAAEKELPFRLPKPNPQHWMDIGIGKGCKLCPILNTREKEIRVDFYINNPDSKAYFDTLAESQHQIEQEYGQPLNWRRLPERKSSIVCIAKTGVDPLDRQQWPAMMEWFTEQLAKMHQVFAMRIKNLDISSRLMEVGAE